MRWLIRKIPHLILTLILGVSPSSIQPAPLTSIADVENSSSALIRGYADGSGPTAIFRLGRIESLKADVFGIVDPIRWRIQYYTLDDWHMGPSERTFEQRWQERGSCALPPTFRVWRIHTFPDRVVLQSQPRVPRGAFLFDRGERPQQLEFGKASLRADQASLAAIVASSPTDSGSVPSKACDANADGTGSPVFSSVDSATSVSGGQETEFILSRSPAARRNSFDARHVKLSYQGRWLSSAQELEDGISVTNRDPIRHFLLTTRTLTPGFVSTETVLFRRSASGLLDRRMIINIGLNRVKLGQRPVAVSSRGEVLVMGAPDKQGFRVHRCTFLPKATTSRCSIDEKEAGGPQGGVSKIVDRGPVGALTRGSMWTTAFKYTDRVFNVDVSSMPMDCRKLVSRCRVAGIDWTPIPELRGGLTKVVTRRGFPYGQVSANPAPPPTPPDAVNAGLGMATGDAGVAVAVGGSVPHFFGDIYNDGKIVRPANAAVFGIDCSSLVSVLWNLGAKWDTGAFISAANARTNRIGRIAGMRNATIGDAFLINVEEAGTRYINHIALFRESIAAGPTDSSRAILVVESSGSCGGVCWSLYDESFFNGWAIIRRTSAPNDTSIVEPIPLQVKKWRSLFTARR